MAVKKRALREEPFLNTVARKLGSAAGTLTRASKDLAESLAALPEKVTAKVEEVGHSEMPAKRRSGTRQHKKRARSAGVRGTSQTAVKKKRQTMRGTATARGRRSSASNK